MVQNLLLTLSVFYEKCVSFWTPCVGPQKEISSVYELMTPNSRCMTTYYRHIEEQTGSEKETTRSHSVLLLTRPVESLHFYTLKELPSKLK